MILIPESRSDVAKSWVHLGNAGREEVVRGYTVSVTYAKVDAAEAQERRKAVAQVIARSVRQMKDEPSSAP